MNSKKAITLLLLTTMLLSLIPVISVNAIAVDAVLDDAYVALAGPVYYGDTVIVMGSGATPGRMVNIYWDGIDDWDGETGFLNSSKAEGNGDYEVWFDVPEAVNGDHWISVENVRNGDTDTWLTAIAVDAKIKLSPKSGLEGDEIEIQGYGYGDEVEITDINFNLAFIDTSPGTPETDDLGSWSATFDVPDLAYADYLVDATDEDLNYAEATFTLGASITLSKEEGPSGTVVRITGRGFTPGASIDEGIITLDGINCGVKTDTSVVKSNGGFTCDIVIPDAGDTDEFTLYVEEGAGGVGLNAEADFEQTGRPAIELTPEYGPVGSTITVKGYNFTQINGEEVILTLNGIGDKTVETNSIGEFSTTFRIPGASGTALLEAVQSDWYLDASENFRVGFITVVIYPEEVTSGTLVTVSGSGFDEAESVNVTLDGDLWIDEIAVDLGGVIADTTNVPSMEAGVYDVVVTESTSGISVTVELEITENTYVDLSPIMAPAGYVVDITGYNFAEDPTDDTVTILLYNDTYEWELYAEYELDDVWEALILDLDEDWDPGYFEANFTLPPDDEISIGSYTLNVTDGEGMYTQMTFEIVDKTVDIEPKKTVFRIGETVGFDVESSFQQTASYIEIYDPSGNLYWETDSFARDMWVKVGTIMRVPYYSQVAGGNPMVLLEDAPLGTWSWTWYDNEDEELDSGTFEVDAAAADVIAEQVQDLNNQITDLADQLNTVSGEFDDVRSDIAAVQAVAQQAVTAAQQAADAVQTVAQTANQANTAAQNAADAANAAKDAANGLTTLVYGAIGAALVAALAAIVSLMQISRRIAG
jgi:hypothetical protein